MHFTKHTVLWHTALVMFAGSMCGVLPLLRCSAEAAQHHDSQQSTDSSGIIVCIDAHGSTSAQATCQTLACESLHTDEATDNFVHVCL